MEKTGGRNATLADSRPIYGYILANPEVLLSILRSTLRQCLEGFFPFRLNFLTSESPPEPRLLGLISSQVNNACGARWHCAKWSCVVWVTSQAAPLKFGKDWPVKRRYRKVARVTRPHTRRLTELLGHPTLLQTAIRRSLLTYPVASGWWQTG